MSFTVDELESFNTILEQRLTAHSKELERIFDQRIQLMRQEFEQRVIAMQQEIIDALAAKLIEHQSGLQSETALEFPDDGQLLDAIEIQTDLPWEELNSLFGKALDERFAILNETTQVALSNWERMLSAQLQGLQMMQNQQHQTFAESSSNTVAELHSFEQLERLVQSLQITMTTNHALLSNRLYRHQQLPLEQAHSGNQDNHGGTTQVAGVHPHQTDNSLSNSIRQEEQ